MFLRLFGLVIVSLFFNVSCRTTSDENTEAKGAAFWKKNPMANESQRRVNTDPRREKIVLAFAGKGTALAWDAGVLNVLYKNVEGIRRNNVVVTGSSSGAVWAAYFACFGINEKSIARMNELVKKFDKKLVNDGGGKTYYVLSGQEWKLNFPHANLDEFIGIGLNNMKCRPSLPTVIAAGNADVLARQFRGILDLKFLGPVRDYMPERIAEDDGQLMNSPLFNRDMFRKVDSETYLVKTTTGKVLGKACTYFVDPIMYKALSEKDHTERKCDLRLMEDAEDMKDAILASVSEPTYFDWWRDRKPEKILAVIPNANNDRGTPIEKKGLRARHYNGGYPMTVVTEDVKKVFPTAYTIGTGRFPLGPQENFFVKNWYTHDGNAGMFQGVWWVDADFVPTPDFWEASGNKEWSADKEIKEGEKAAEGLLRSARDARPDREWMIPPKNTRLRHNGRVLDMTHYRDRGIRAILDRQVTGQ